MAGCDGICDGLPGVAQPTVCQEVNKSVFTHSALYKGISDSDNCKTEKFSVDRTESKQFFSLLVSCKFFKSSSVWVYFLLCL